MVFESEREKFEGFNTASGKYCCNVVKFDRGVSEDGIKVSIPQAVSTVATQKPLTNSNSRLKEFQYRKR